MQNDRSSYLRCEPLHCTQRSCTRFRTQYLIGFRRSRSAYLPWTFPASGLVFRRLLDHIPKIAEFLLKHSYFTVGGLVFRQIQGASMGSHFAPALCGLVAAFQEYCFHKAFQGMRTHHRLLHNSRYVDNRVLLHFPGWRDSYPWNLFTQLDFYEAPILLEEVDDSEILGCTISTIQRTITVRQPKDLVSLRSGLSEDSDVAVISAFRARALLIIRYTFPVSLIFDQLEDLIAIFEQKFVTSKQLSCTRRTLWKILQTKSTTNSTQPTTMWTSHENTF